MAKRKPSCTNTPQYLRSCCSPIGQNNTKDFSAQSGGSIGRAVWKWSDKSRFPGALSALLVNLRRLPAQFISSRLSQPPLGLRGWVRRFRIFHSVIPVSMLGCINQIWTVACLLLSWPAIARGIGTLNYFKRNTGTAY